MKLKVYVATATILVLSTLGFMFFYPVREINFEKTNYNELNLNDIEKLMIVAHPDDEILWGGTELLKDNYLVVCVTCGSDSRRVKEFETVMGETNDAYVMLGYPDKTKGERDNWDSVREEIIEDIENIYKLKKWKEVVTHNPEGEYGHIHHKMTNGIVTDLVDHDRLYYFGKYHSKRDLEEKGDEDLRKIDEEALAKKEEILNLYVTQDHTLHKTLGHMIPYEEKISFDDWSERYEEEN